MALLVADLPTWRQVGKQASLAARLADVDSVQWERFGVCAKGLVIDRETERRHWRAYNQKRMSAYLDGRTDVSGLEEE